ncbi:hypothetical protein [Ornithinimicrobium sediminis]|uniref:hypothetical protein n=1 Tax=Ornithinimicrobium sediminis TaxID=2904603 RepID=UPI001E35C26B|nr:hypothetical protein [Ornithinimicrobium sediminis]MCE0485658.1 hypothetical protein [Ornithinimicrobium sediminis]
MRQQLASLTAGSGGVFLRADALVTDHTDDDIRAWARSGEVRRLRRGVFAVGAEPGFAADRMLEQAAGLARLHGDDIALSHHTALVLQGVAVHEVPFSEVWSVRVGGAVQSGPGLRVVRPRTAPTLVRVGGIQAVTSARAVLQVAGSFGAAAGIVSADSAVDKDLVTADDLAQELGRLGRRPGAAAARATVDRCRRGAQSPGETLLRLFAEDLGHEVELQFPVAEPSRQPFAFTDLRIVGTRSLWEFDGLRKYAGAAGAAALAAEKVREDRIRRLGWGLERVVWVDFRRPEQLADRITQAARRHRIR